MKFIAVMLLWCVGIAAAIVVYGFVAMGFVWAVIIVVVTAPVWLPVQWYFTAVWHAKERANRAMAELATRNVMDANTDPALRRPEDYWWRADE